MLKSWWCLDEKFFMRALLLQWILNLAPHVTPNSLKSPLDAKFWAGHISAEHLWQNPRISNLCLVNLMLISALYWEWIQRHSHSDSNLEMSLVTEKHILAHTHGWCHFFYAFVTTEQFNLLNCYFRWWYRNWNSCGIIGPKHFCKCSEDFKIWRKKPQNITLCNFYIQ